MRWITVTIYFILSLINTLSGQNANLQSNASINLDMRFPGSFSWTENTVIKTLKLPSSRILQYQAILDHSNSEFNDNGESLILAELIGDTTVENRGASIRVTQDTILVQSYSEKSMEKALRYLRKMKRNAEVNSPDYGLIYLRCGLYRIKNF